MPNRLAIIDIGTNTVNLLIVDREHNSYTIVYTDRKGVGLGHGGINNSLITEAAFNRGIDCLKIYAEVCKSYETNSIYAFGTSALRNAANSLEFIDSVKNNTQININVLSGQDEANLIYKGIKLGYDFNKRSVVMDIGGGSTEFILADSSGIIDKYSFEIGVSRINQLFEFKNTFTNDDILKVETYLDKNIGNQLDSFTTDNLIGSSGSFETFYELTHQKKYPVNEYHKIDLKSINTTLNKIITSNLTERINNPFIIPIRREMLPIAAIKTKWILTKLNCTQLIVSPNSLKEGAIFGM
jgi:exopolyphosphatase/guanosine-5'-triphosphate,3'-diphosphate pyrophosphatase